jgi:hypothetical protein
MEKPPGPGDECAPEPRAKYAPTSPARGTDINAQLSQACELEAKLAEEYRVVRLLRASIAGEASAHGERVHELGKPARERINADFNVDDPNTPQRTSQTLRPQRCSGPCPHPRRPRRKTCTARHRRSLSRWPYNSPTARHPTYASKAARGTTAVPKARKRPFTQAARWGSGPTRAERRSGSRSLTHAGRSRMATPATSSTLAEREMQRHEWWWATTLSGAATMTVARIAHRRRNPRGPVCSAGRSGRRASPSASASPPRSTNTQGRCTLVYGSTITARRAS